jgi:hypothetical protein
MEEVILTSCQSYAIDRVLTNYKEKRHMTISGPAGSGKSFLTKYLLSKLDELRVSYVLCTPTHAAKNVLTKMSGKAAVTIHSLLRIHPETYEDQQEFAQSKVPDLSNVRLVIVDEASMVDDDLFAILMNSIHPDCVVLGIGDKKQIQPVKHSPGRKSPFFRPDVGLDQIEIKTIVRQSADNPLIQVATKIRCGGWIYENFDKVKKQGVLKCRDFNQMMTAYLRQIKTPSDLINYRVLSYTNEVVNSVNKIIRKHVYKTEEPYVVGEYLVLQQPVIIEYEKDGEKFSEVLLNNGEIVKIVRLEYNDDTKISLPLTLTKHAKTARLFVVSVDDVDIKEGEAETEDSEEYDDSELVSFEVIWDVDSSFEISATLQEGASQYKQLNRYDRATKNYWKMFWALKNRFIETKSLGAQTFHKSQGSTVTGVCIIQNGLNMLSDTEAEELLYVGTTRPTKWALYI